MRKVYVLTIMENFADEPVLDYIEGVFASEEAARIVGDRKREEADNVRYYIEEYNVEI